MIDIKRVLHVLEWEIRKYLTEWSCHSSSERQRTRAETTPRGEIFPYLPLQQNAIPYFSHVLRILILTSVQNHHVNLLVNRLQLNHHHRKLLRNIVLAGVKRFYSRQCCWCLFSFVLPSVILVKLYACCDTHTH